MRRSSLKSIVSISLILSTGSLVSQTNQVLRFEHANVLTMNTNAVLKDAVVICTNGLITYVGSAVKAPVAKGSRVIDLHGQYLMPGLTDMHTHLSYTEASSDMDVQDELFVYLANGVTTIRNMSGSSWHLIIRKRLASEDILGPRMFTTGPILDRKSEYAEMQPPTFKPLTSAEEARIEVRSEKADGYDFVKIYNQLDQPVYDALVETSKEEGMPVVGHVPIIPGLKAVFQNHQASIEHYRGYDLELSTDPKSTSPEVRFAGWRSATDERLHELTDRTIEAGAWNVPTFLTLQLVNDTPENRAIARDYPYLPAHMYAALPYDINSIFPPPIRRLFVEGLPRMYAFTKMLNDAGAPIMAGTDGGAPGIGLHREIETMHMAGLSNYDSLRTATSTPGAWFARYAPLSERTGVVEIGRRADFIILKDNPLDNLNALGHIQGVIIRGKYLSASDIKAKLEDIRSRNAPLIAAIKAKQLASVK